MLGSHVKPRSVHVSTLWVGEAESCGGEDISQIRVVQIVNTACGSDLTPEYRLNRNSPTNPSCGVDVAE
jgi:hypothetical protein